MRVKKSSNVNMRFLFGAVVFFAVIIFVVMLFTYFTVKYASENKAADVYTVSFSKDFVADSCLVTLDDSVLYAASPVDVNWIAHVQQYVVEKDSAGKKSRVRHFGPQSMLRAVVPGMDTLEVAVGDEVAFRIAMKDGRLVVER